MLNVIFICQTNKNHFKYQQVGNDLKSKHCEDGRGGFQKMNVKPQLGTRVETRVCWYLEENQRCRNRKDL